MTDQTITEAPDAAPARYGVLGIIVAVVFGLLFAFYLYESIDQALQLSTYVTAQNVVLKRVGHTLLAFPWVPIIAYLVLPFVAYGLALAIGRRRTFVVKAGLFLIALALVSAGSLSLEAVASAATRIT